MATRGQMGTEKPQLAYQYIWDMMTLRYPSSRQICIYIWGLGEQYGQGITT